MNELALSLPVFVVVLPILAAVAIFTIGRWFGNLGHAVAVGVLSVQTALTAIIAYLVVRDGAWSVGVGGFAPPYGIELAVDTLSAGLVALVTVVALGVLLTFSRSERPDAGVYGLYLLLVGGLSGLSITRDVFNLYVFLEISGLATYALIASSRTGRAAYAALKYLLVGTAGASLYLIGLGYAYVATGTLNMADMSGKLAAVGYDSPLVLAAFAFMAVGFAIKIALFPLHTWQPNAYAEAPDRITVVVAALVSTVAAYALARLLYAVFTPAFFIANPLLRTWLLVAGAVSLVAGSLFAIRQTEIKRMLAYSSVAQFGLIVTAFGLANEAAVTGGVVHLFGHAVIKGGLFLAAALIASRLGARTLEEYNGIAARMPVTSAAFAVLALALVGIPPTIGFAGKLYIALGAVESGAWLLVAVIVGSTLLTLGYVVRLLERMYFTSPATAPTSTATDGGAPVTDTRAIIVLVAAAILAIALGIGVSALEQFFDPTIETLLNT